MCDWTHAHPLSHHAPSVCVGASLVIPVCLPATQVNATSFPIPHPAATNRTASLGAELTERREGEDGGETGENGKERRRRMKSQRLSDEH